MKGIKKMVKVRIRNLKMQEKYKFLKSKPKQGKSGQTREGIGAVAVRVWRRQTFVDAPDTSVVLLVFFFFFPGRVECEGEDGEEEEKRWRVQWGGRGSREMDRTEKRRRKRKIIRAERMKTIKTQMTLQLCSTGGRQRAASF